MVEFFFCLPLMLPIDINQEFGTEAAWAIQGMGNKFKWKERKGFEVDEPTTGVPCRIFKDNRMDRSWRMLVFHGPIGGEYKFVIATQSKTDDDPKWKYHGLWYYERWEGHNINGPVAKDQLAVFFDPSPNASVDDFNKPSYIAPDGRTRYSSTMFADIGKRRALGVKVPSPIGRMTPFLLLCD